MNGESLKKDGVTQSQTLLIMGIVGLVLFAFIAVPFYNSCKQKQVITKLKTLNTQLAQANKIYSLATSTNPDEYDYNLSIDKFAETYYTPYMKIVSTCKESQDECWNKIQYTDLAGKKYIDKIKYSIILSDKTVIGFYKNKDGLISIIADIDGKAGKNKLGRDVFVFYFYNDKVSSELCKKSNDIYIKKGMHFGGYDKCGIPHDMNSYSEVYGKDLEDSCNKKAPNTQNGIGVGAACLALIYKGNWTIDKIYPW